MAFSSRASIFIDAGDEGFELLELDSRQFDDRSISLGKRAREDQRCIEPD
jgi:hypothetical protein